MDGSDGVTARYTLKSHSLGLFWGGLRGMESWFGMGASEIGYSTLQGRKEATEAPGEDLIDPRSASQVNDRLEPEPAFVLVSRQHVLLSHPLLPGVWLV
jgi:hypothetical protein